MHHLKVRNPDLRAGRLIVVYLLVLSVAASLTGEIIVRHNSSMQAHPHAKTSSNATALATGSLTSNTTTCQKVSLSPALPEPGKIFLGVTTPHAGWSMDGTAKFAQQVGAQPEVAMFYSGWGGKPTFNATPFNNIHNAGMMPMLDWEPWNYLTPSAVSVGQFNQSAFSDASLMSGSYRSFLESWAVGIKKLGYPVALNFAHEMNGNWYPWAASVNGNTPASFVAL